MSPNPNTGVPVSSHCFCSHKQRRKLRLGTEALARGHAELEIKPKSVGFPKPCFSISLVPQLPALVCAIPGQKDDPSLGLEQDSGGGAQWAGIVCR